MQTKVVIRTLERVFNGRIGEMVTVDSSSPVERFLHFLS